MNDATISLGNSVNTETGEGLQDFQDACKMQPLQNFGFSSSFARCDLRFSLLVFVHRFGTLFPRRWQRRQRGSLQRKTGWMWL